MQHRGGDVLALADAVRLLDHGEVRVLVGSPEVIGLEAWVEAVSRPCASAGALALDDKDILVRVVPDVSFGGSQAVPT